MQFTLHAGESAALAPACTVRVRCHAGYLWITGFRNGEDVVLGAGDSALLPPAQRHYFSALGREPHAAFELGCEARDGMARGRYCGHGGIAGAKPPCGGYVWGRLGYRHLLRRLRHLLQ